MKQNKLLIFSLTTLLFLFFIFPSSSVEGAKKGLLLWSNTVLPSLLPFMIISNVMIMLEITSYISSFFYPLFHTILRVSKEGCYPVVVGMLSGYPIGAKACADLLKQEKISLEEGQFLLSICNNASPMFITCYIAEECFHLPEHRYIFFAIMIGCSFLSGILFKYTAIFLKKIGLSSTKAKKQLKKQSLTVASLQSNAPNMTSVSKQNTSLLQVFDTSIQNSFEVLTKVGGYIILFSLLGQIISDLSFISIHIKVFLSSILEVVTGVNSMSASFYPIHIKIALTFAITAFGGLSSLVQTKSVITNSGLSLTKYFYTKILNMLLTFIFMYIYLIYII